MNKHTLKNSVMILSLAIASGTVSAANNLELLDIQGKDFRGSQDPVQIKINNAVVKDNWKYLHLEIDSVDVTDMTSINSGILKYVPQEKLTSGSHNVRLVAILPDGNIDELANWEVSVRASANFLESTTESNFDLNVTQRVVDNFTTNDVNETQGQGSYVFASNLATDNFRLTSNADFIYNSQTDQTQNGKEVDINEYNLTSEWSQSSVILGHQTVPVSSLVLNDFNRRGVSANYHNETNSFAATGFALRTEAITGGDDGLGISHKDKRTSGTYVRINPITESPEKLIISGVYINGMGNSEGSAELSDSLTEGEGDASTILVESYVNKKRVYLRGEYASSSFDFDGGGTGYAAESDAASSLYVQYATERNNERTKDYNWNLGFLHQKVGTWFHSLGNATLPSDKQSSQITGSYMSPQWQLNSNLSLEKNNTKNDSSVPTVETRILSANLTYTPQSDTENIQQGMFGNPNFTLSFLHNDNKQIQTPSGFLGDTVNLANREIAIAASFSGDSWNWSLSHTFSSENDLTNVNSDFNNRMTSFDANFQVNDKFSVTPVLQITENRNIDQKITTDGTNVGLTMQYTNNENWNASVGYSNNSEKANDGFTDRQTDLYEMQTTWIYQQAKENKPGINYFARASYAGTEELAVKTDQYQVFLGVTIAWPANF